MTARKAANWSTPTATLVLPAGAARQEWLAQRRKGLGSSDAALLMGVGYPDDSEYELWLDKTGRAEPGQQTAAMQRGVWLEPHVAGFFADKTRLALRRCGLMRHKDEPILLATPDRLVGDGGVVEIKTMGAWAKTGVEWRDGIARHAYIQGQWQLMVTGRSHAWFCAYTIDKEPMIRGPVERDEPLIERMRDRARSWWETHIHNDTEPPVDLATITDEEIALRWPTAEPGSTAEAQWPAYLRQMLHERAECKAAEKAAKERSDEIDKALKVMAGPAEALLLGERPVATFKTQRNNPSVDPALETDLPEVWEKYIKRGSSRRIRIVKNWEQM
ncbi:MAG: YqaJ viral recombinase family protein [Pseudonocardiaceae bacterium]